MIGYFINMLPLRADLSGDPPFSTLLRRVGATVLDALEHQDYPFASAGRAAERRARPQPRSARAGLVHARKGPSLAAAWRVAFLPAAVRSPALGRVALQIEQYYVEQHSSQSDLEMAFEEGDGTVEGMLRYNKDLFDNETVRRMIGHFLTILDGIADNPYRRLSELPWLTEAERRLVVHDWNATRVDFPHGAVPAPPVRAAGRPNSRRDCALRRWTPIDLRRAGHLVEPTGASACAGLGPGRGLLSHCVSSARPR